MADALGRTSPYRFAERQRGYNLVKRNEEETTTVVSMQYDCWTTADAPSYGSLLGINGTTSHIPRISPPNTAVNNVSVAGNTTMRPFSRVPILTGGSTNNSNTTRAVTTAGSSGGGGRVSPNSGIGTVVPYMMQFEPGGYTTIPQVNNTTNNTYFTANTSTRINNNTTTEVNNNLSAQQHIARQKRQKEMREIEEEEYSQRATATTAWNTNPRARKPLVTPSSSTSPQPQSPPTTTGRPSGSPRRVVALTSDPVPDLQHTSWQGKVTVPGLGRSRYFVKLMHGNWPHVWGRHGYFDKRHPVIWELTPTNKTTMYSLVYEDDYTRFEGVLDTIQGKASGKVQHHKEGHEHRRGDFELERVHSDKSKLDVSAGVMDHHTPRASTIPPSADVVWDQMGLRLANENPGAEPRVIVTDVRPGSAGAEVSIVPGHIVAGFDRQPVQSLQDFCDYFSTCIPNTQGVLEMHQYDNGRFTGVFDVFVNLTEIDMLLWSDRTKEAQRDRPVTWRPAAQLQPHFQLTPPSPTGPPAEPAVLIGKQVGAMAPPPTQV